MAVALRTIGAFRVFDIILGYTLVPVVWLFLSTIQTQGRLLTLAAPTIAAEVTLCNYVDIFTPAAFGETSGHSTFVLALPNSVVVSVGADGMAIVFGTSAAYAFARFNVLTSARYC